MPLSGCPSPPQGALLPSQGPREGLCKMHASLASTAPALCSQAASRALCNFPASKSTVYQDLVYLIARSAAVTVDYKLGSLNHRDLLFSISGGWKAEIKVSAGPVPSEAVMGKGASPLFLAAGGLLQVFCVPWLVDTSPCLCLRVTWHPPCVCLSVSTLSLFIGYQSH